MSAAGQKRKGSQRAYSCSDYPHERTSLMRIKSNLVGCITGRSAGFSPLKTRPT